MKEVPLEIGERVRYFTPTICYYHGRRGTVIGRKASSYGDFFEYTVQPDDLAEPPKYLCQNAVYGVMKWVPRRPLECGFECRMQQEVTL